MPPTASNSLIHSTEAAQPHINNPGHSGLLPALLKAQKQNGYISKPVAAEIARALQVPLADVYGVIEFYALLYSKPTAVRVIRICGDPACSIAGSHTALKLCVPAWVLALTKPLPMAGLWWSARHAWVCVTRHQRRW
ncbi:NADH-quinone oxidoreductase chain 2 [Anaerolineaceae bacterium]|nr:NADH-quinone oxidoreductase chain 2 [Anaerolineaceae bacterium]